MHDAMCCVDICDCGFQISQVHIPYACKLLFQLGVDVNGNSTENSTDLI